MLQGRVDELELENQRLREVITTLANKACALRVENHKLREGR